MGFIFSSSTLFAAQKTAVNTIKPSKTITWVQVELNKLGYFQGHVNGILDTDTQKAVKLFQEKNGLKVDGIPGRMTRKAMKRQIRKIKKAAVVKKKAEMKIKMKKIKSEVKK